MRELAPRGRWDRDDDVVRSIYLVFVLVALLVAAGSASGAAPSPQALVLQQADVPAGFRFDAVESRVQSNASLADGDPESRTIIARSGRLTGYEAVFEKKDGTLIESRADLFRSPAGARILLDWFDREVKKEGATKLTRDVVDIGAGGWFFTHRDASVRFTLGVWRHDRVVAYILAFGPRTKQVLALARAQQRRIAATLG